MSRLKPYLIFVLITGGLLAFIYKDRIFPPNESQVAAQQQRGPGGGGFRSGGGGRRGVGQAVPVTVEKVQTDNVPVYLTGVGTVQAYNTTTVRAQVSGRLIEVGFQEGQEVKKGDVLARIDPVLYQAIYDQAVAKKAQDEALLSNSRLDEKRYTDLARSNSATQQQADTARASVHQNEAQIRQDQAAIDNAKANLDYCTIRAPISGRTGLRLVDVGNLVSSVDATGIVVITQLKPISVVFTLPENRVAEILEAQGKGRVDLQAVVGGQIIGEGKLEVVDNQIDQTTGTVRIKGTFPNEQNRLWPGQFVNVKLKLKILENATVVPSVAIQQGANGSYVFVVTPDNTAKLANVTVDLEGERRSVISKGVTPGDVVVASGFASLQDGSKLRIDEGGAKGEASERPHRQNGAGEQRRRQNESNAGKGAGSGSAPSQADTAQAQDLPAHAKPGDKAPASRP